MKKTLTTLQSLIQSPSFFVYLTLLSLLWIAHFLFFQSPLSNKPHKSSIFTFFQFLIFYFLYRTTDSKFPKKRGSLKPSLYSLFCQGLHCLRPWQSRIRKVQKNEKWDQKMRRGVKKGIEDFIFVYWDWKGGQNEKQQYKKNKN
jgi:hypothetical protein